ncbi:MetQ/NlpA family ABC transporter substrate-binding protein [Veillonella rogosae]|uniref:MetQ/NlpA family ABC transporter substrate-binding protein n=1 Tax=Veillonella rogosae TaxID=423477 RepID=UPI0006D23D10|nr:MetQ/NlpA family ABC transporter substrate-binding protein [Veillonella rogosae]
MRKFLALAATVILGGALLIAGCGNDNNKQAASDSKQVLKIGATAVPHAEILEQVKPILAKEGIELKITEFTDYNTPNLALGDKEIDANFFQHIPYMDEFAKSHKLNLVSAGGVHLEPMGLYSRQIKDLKDLPKGAKIAIPNDPTNGGRALLLLQKQGLITLKDSSNILSTVQDIVSNPNDYQFVELEAAQVPRSLDDVALAAINTNYALNAGLTPGKDALAIESKDSPPYVNIVTVLKGNESDPKIKKLMEALHTPPEIKKFIEEKYKGAVVPAF